MVFSGRNGDREKGQTSGHPAIQSTRPDGKGNEQQNKKKGEGRAGGRAGDVFIDLASFLEVW